MADHPLIMSAPMVCALLEGRKTMTRRVLKRLMKFGEITEFGPSSTPGFDWHFRDKQMRWHDLTDAQLRDHLARQPGDRIWVRETFTLTQHGKPVYRADARDQDGSRWSSIQPGDPEGEVLWKPPIYMPRWASRLTLLVKGVRVERLQDISEEDAVAEGAIAWAEDGDAPMPRECAEPVLAFRRLWNSLHGAGAWGENPWICAISFRCENSNIDEVKNG